MQRIILLPPETQNPRWNPGACASQATLRITSDCNMGSNLLQVFNYCYVLVVNHGYSKFACI